jgi:secreted PhoX family phosphatase
VAALESGGPNDATQAGHVFAAPDNLSFDAAGNMWVVSDISSANLDGANSNYTAFKNHGMFFVPTGGSGAGHGFQFASGPCESELTGPSWTPDETTLFLAIQHPGETSGRQASTAAAPRGSNWPHRPHGVPRPAVVQIRRD